MEEEEEEEKKRPPKFVVDEAQNLYSYYMLRVVVR